MKKEFQKHFFPLITIYILVSVIWLFNKVFYSEFIFLFLGLLLGAFLLDIDHLIYWLYLKPNLDESKTAQDFIEKKDFKSLLRLLINTHKNHTSLIFHHFFSQIVLALISFFVFTSSNSTFAMAFILAINVHLLVDEFYDFFEDPKHLQNWLFAREEKQLPIKYLKHYLIIFTVVCSFFIFLLIRSNL